MNEIKLNIELTPAEADEVIAGLHSHAAGLQSLAQKILIMAQGQYQQIIAQPMVVPAQEVKEQETKIEEKSKNEEGENS